jgi:hypothetical protein
MSDKTNPSSDSPAAAASTSSNRYTPYIITHRAKNTRLLPPPPPASLVGSLPNHLQGNYHDSRIQPVGPAYHYSNTVRSSHISRRRGMR